MKWVTAVLFSFLSVLGFGCNKKSIQHKIDDKTYVELPSDLTVEEKLVSSQIKKLMDARIKGDDALIDKLLEPERTRVRNLQQFDQTLNESLVDYGANFSILDVLEQKDSSSVITAKAWIAELRKDVGEKDSNSGFEEFYKFTVVDGKVVSIENIGISHPQRDDVRSIKPGRWIIIKALPNSPWNPASREDAVNFKPGEIGSLNQLKSPLSTSSFRSYALRWCGGFNPAYPNYNRQGGDCTNFVSQCLEAGNLPFIDNPNSPYRKNWAMFWWSNPRNRRDHSFTWSSANGLRNHLRNRVNSGYMHFSNDQAHVGDVVFFDFNRDGLQDHACAVTRAEWVLVGWYSQFVLEVSCHTNNRCSSNLQRMTNGQNWWVEIVHVS
jgi:hypothetical protein